MLQQKEYILNSLEDHQLIASVKASIEEVLEAGKFFNLPLKTLELIRRFNMFHSEVFQKLNDSPANVNQLLIISRALEGELLRINLD